MDERAPLPVPELDPIPPDEASELEALASASFLGSLQQFISTVPDRISHQLKHEKAEIAAGVIFGAFQFIAAYKSGTPSRASMEWLRLSAASAWGFMGAVVGDQAIRILKGHLNKDRAIEERNVHKSADV